MPVSAVAVMTGGVLTRIVVLSSMGVVSCVISPTHKTRELTTPTEAIAMPDPVNACPECGALETERQMIDWLRDGVDIVYSCPACRIDFVAAFRHPTKEVVHEYEEVADAE